MPPKEEFDELEENDRKRSTIRSDLTMSQGKRFNDEKFGKLNLRKDILPYDQSRVKLRSTINKIDYINASWVQRCHDENVYDDVYEFLTSSKMNFIVTQDPTKDTQQHYYQMLFEQQVDVVVHISSDSNLQHWETRSFGNAYIELVERVNLEENIMREKMNIFVKSDALIHSHPTTVYHFTAWPSDDHFGEEDSKRILTLISLVQRDVGKPTTKFTIASHDASGGVGGASTFIVLFQMQQELNTKLKVRKQGQIEIESVNVFQKVNEMRKQRAHMIATFQNYRFLFNTLAYYAKNQSFFEKITTTVEPVPTPKITPANNSTTIGQQNDIEAEYVYSDDISIDPLYQNERITSENYESDIYVN